MIAMFSGQMQNSPVERYKRQIFSDGYTEQESIGNLFVAMQTFEKRRSQNMPVARDGLVVIAGALF
jgi:hypothetical protein